jgi:LuxR family maltose regulon positive regulatory protein
MIVANALDDNRYVTDYRLTEVLSQLPVSVQTFLIKTSILDQLRSLLCEAVTGVVDRTSSGQSTLEWLERADSFLAPVDDPQRLLAFRVTLPDLRKQIEELSKERERLASLIQRAEAAKADQGE